MSISNLTIHENREYQKYLNCGGQMGSGQYRDYLHAAQDKIMGLICNDPGDHLSDICQRILKYSDIKTRLALAQTCQGLYQRCQRDFLVDDFRRIIVWHIQKNTSYADYVKENRVSLFFGSLTKVIVIGAGIFFFYKSALHRALIPPDAPIAKYPCSKGFNDLIKGECEYIDHPEARLATEYEIKGMMMVTLVALKIYHRVFKVNRIYDFPKDCEKDIFFEIAFDIKTTLRSSKFISLDCDYLLWKIEKMRKNLASNPTGWEKDPILSQFMCPLSKNLMLFPVKDKCDHNFEFQSIRTYQLDRRNKFPFKCPLSEEKFAFKELRFNMTLFYIIQSTIGNLNPQRVLKNDTISPPTQQTDDDPNVVGETSTAGAFRMAGFRYF